VLCPSLESWRQRSLRLCGLWAWPARPFYAKAFDKAGLVNMFKKSGIDTSWAPAELGAPAAAASTTA